MMSQLVVTYYVIMRIKCETLHGPSPSLILLFSLLKIKNNNNNNNNLHIC